MRKKILTLALLAILIAGSIAYVHYKHSIRYSLYQTYKAYKEHDITGFEKYVDIQGVLSNIIDHITTFDNPDDKELADLVGGLVSIVKPGIIPSLRQDVVDIIESSKHEQKEYDDSNGNLITSLINRYIPRGNGKIFRGIAYRLHDGKIAYVGTRIYQPRYDTTLIVELKMRDKGAYWQIADIPNIKTYIHQIDSLEEKHIEQKNRLLISQMNKVIVPESFHKKNMVQEGWFFTTHSLRCQIIIRNNSNKSIAGYKMRTYCLDRDNDTLARFTLSSDKSLEPGQRDTLSILHNISFYDDRDRRLYDLPADSLQLRVDIIQIQYSDGTSTKLLEKWE